MQMNFIGHLFMSHMYCFSW